MDCKDYHNLVEVPKTSSKRQSSERTRSGRSESVDVDKVEVQEVYQDVNNVVNQKSKFKSRRKSKNAVLMHLNHVQDP